MSKEYNNLTKKSKASIAKNAAEWTAKKRKSGEIKTLSLSCSQEQIATINQAITLAGGSKVAAITKICEDYIRNHENTTE